MFFIHSVVYGQSLKEFPKPKNEFIAELGKYMSASKSESLNKVFKEFEGQFKSGLFSEEEYELLYDVASGMLNQRMTAGAYFGPYLDATVAVKRLENGADRYKQWQTVLKELLAGIENRRIGPYKDYLDFSVDFFHQNALRYSASGTSWKVNSNKFQFKVQENQPVIVFEETDLVAYRKIDSITINETSGIFYPYQNIWKGSKGKVEWGPIMADVHAELAEYQIDMSKSLYEAEGVTLHYPLFFGNETITGRFSDKISLSMSDSTFFSFPRFESESDTLEIKNIGEGIHYSGGFRLYGSTIYGFGVREKKASIWYSQEGKLLFKGLAEQFIIRKEETIIGEGVEMTIYINQDSIFHPSANIRFLLKDKELEISRGERGKDRNPFFSSYHQMNFDADNFAIDFLQDTVYIGQKTISLAYKPAAYFESLLYFDQNDFYRFQNIASSNPIAKIGSAVPKKGERNIDANSLAASIDPKFNVDNIKGLLYDLASKGFLNYDGNKQQVEVKDKVYHYVEADRKQTDYDYLKIRSETDSANAILDLKTQELTIGAAKNVELSKKQQVAIVPDNGRVKVKANRNMDFDGRLFAGFSIMTGRQFHFDYNKFNIQLDSVKYFDLFVETGEIDQNNKLVAEAIGSRIENLSGTLLIDAPSNKSGKEDIEIFPTFKTHGKSYVYYDSTEFQKDIYPRDSFYFELTPFNFEHLDKIKAEDLVFNGSFYSADIFPVITEKLVLRKEDKSLGFISKTPDNGYPTYKGKGNYKGSFDLSNSGLHGVGKLNYLWSTIESKDFFFKPYQALSTADKFHLDEDKSSKVPKADGEKVAIDWRPYNDSLYVTAEEPFRLFGSGKYNLTGQLILTPEGLRGNGSLDWDKAIMYSKLFSFGTNSVLSDTANIQIKALEDKKIALATSNVNANVDFDKKKATFKANEEYLVTTLPYNQYQTSINEFTWDMGKEKVAFKADPTKMGVFVSIHPNQDSLRFEGRVANYDLKTNLLQVEEVPFVKAADAFIYPDSNFVEIQKDAVITTLQNARIVADTINKNHVINDCTVDILGRRNYRARGFYEYNIADKEQKIEFTEIIGQPVGKGKWSDKQTETRATGQVKEEDNFYIDKKTEFRGTISLNAGSKNLFFDGFARLDADKLPNRQWFTIRSEGAKEDLVIKYQGPKNYEGEPVETGLFLSKERAEIYPRVMMPLGFRKDRAIMSVKGAFRYDEKNDHFIFGDSTKLIANGLRGNKLVFKNTDGSVEVEGKFNIGEKLNYVSVEAAGKASAMFSEEPKDTAAVMLEENALPPPPPIQKPVKADMMAGVSFTIPEKLIKMIETDFKSSTFDAGNIAYLTDIDFYKKVVHELIPANEETKEMLEALNLGLLDIPKKYNKYTLLFSKLPMRWDPQLQSFVSTSSNLGLISINGETINKMITAYVEFKMPSNDDDRVYIYIKSSGELFYFFSYKQGILSIESNNSRFMEELSAMKPKDRIFKMPDGENYEIAVEEQGTANAFLRRIQQANK